MDFSGINWSYLAVVAALAILVGGFVACATFITTQWVQRRRDKRWDAELNGEGAPADIVDLPKQGGPSDGS